MMSAAELECFVSRRLLPTGGVVRRVHLAGEDTEQDIERQRLEDKRRKNREKARIYRQRHPDRVAARKKRYAEKNREKVAATKRRWLLANQERVKKSRRLAMRRWRERHKERLLLVRRAYARAYFLKNRDAINARRRKLAAEKRAR